MVSCGGASCAITACAGRTQHLHGVNDYRGFLGARSPHGLPEELVTQIKEEIPFGVSHPLLRTHPEILHGLKVVDSVGPWPSQPVVGTVGCGTLESVTYGSRKWRPERK